MENKKFVSTTQLAKILGVSRVTVFKKIRTGQIKARKIGRCYVISMKNLSAIAGDSVSKDQKKEIKKAIDKAVRQYGEVFRLLGQE